MPDALVVHQGALLAILGMAVVTYLCRIGGVWMMGHIPLTLRVRRGLAALPGSIIAATVLPIALKSGPAAIVALAATVVSMALRRNELLALAVGLATVSALRAAGL
jgi:uncharacterized membrane protein